MPKYTLKSQKNGNKEQIELKIGKKMRKSLEVRAITMIFYTINKIWHENLLNVGRNLK